MKLSRGSLAKDHFATFEKVFGFQVEFVKAEVQTNCELVSGRKGGQKWKALKSKKEEEAMEGGWEEKAGQVITKYQILNTKLPNSQY